MGSGGAERISGSEEGKGSGEDGLQCAFVERIVVSFHDGEMMG